MDRNALAELLQALESRRDAEERRREERYTALIERSTKNPVTQLLPCVARMPSCKGFQLVMPLEESMVLLTFPIIISSYGVTRWHLSHGPLNKCVEKYRYQPLICLLIYDIKFEKSKTIWGMKDQVYIVAFMILKEFWKAVLHKRILDKENER
ncbi:UNVERIFIED_CONTAM: hypothetical protein FKN15_001769 [Acipenser sinensis]